MDVYWTKLRDDSGNVVFPDAKGPVRAHRTDSGSDLFAAERIVICPGEVVHIRTGICIQPGPLGCEPGSAGSAFFGYDKSGRASSGLALLSGVIDWEFTGEIRCVMTNLNMRAGVAALFAFMERMRSLDANARWVVGDPNEIQDNRTRQEKAMHAFDEAAIVVESGEKIAQFCLFGVEYPHWVHREALEPRGRGTDGWGSSGLH